MLASSRPAPTNKYASSGVTAPLYVAPSLRAVVPTQDRHLGRGVGWLAAFGDSLPEQLALELETLEQRLG